MKFIIYVLALFFATASESSEQESLFFAMGSKLLIKAQMGPLKSSERDEFMTKISQSLHTFEASISTWTTDSELSQFNSLDAQWRRFNDQTYFSLKSALKCSLMTNRYFHPGLGSLIKLWGLRKAMNTPSKEKILEALRTSSLDQLEFDDDKLSIRKKNHTFEFEEGGFAKGAALDFIVSEARKAKLSDLFLNFSGQVFSMSKKEIGIAHPLERQNPVVFVTVENESVSTSSIGLQHFTYKNKIYGHILNPHTGYPLENKLRSLTVIHPQNFEADCLSTGLLVMSENEKEFRSWVRSHPEVKFILLEHKAEKIKVTSSCNLLKKIKMIKGSSQVIEKCL